MDDSYMHTVSGRAVRDYDADTHHITQHPATTKSGLIHISVHSELNETKRNHVESDRNLISSSLYQIVESSWPLIRCAVTNQPTDQQIKSGGWARAGDNYKLFPEKCFQSFLLFLFYSQL